MRVSQRTVNKLEVRLCCKCPFQQRDGGAGIAKRNQRTAKIDQRRLQARRQGQRPGEMAHRLFLAVGVEQQPAHVVVRFRIVRVQLQGAQVVPMCGGMLAQCRLGSCQDVGGHGRTRMPRQQPGRHRFGTSGVTSLDHGDHSLQVRQGRPPGHRMA